jgi:hypothetical protein
MNLLEESNEAGMKYFLVFGFWIILFQRFFNLAVAMGSLMLLKFLSFPTFCWCQFGFPIGIVLLTIGMLISSWFILWAPDVYEVLALTTALMSTLARVVAMAV